jgi:hypothetical protein
MANNPTRLLRFGSGAQFFYFPQVQQAYRDTSNNIMTRTVRLPGLSGGFDLYGTDAAPHDIGRVTISFVLVASSRGAMQALRDTVNAMASWGVRRLYIQPGDQSERWAEARVSNITMAQEFSNHTDLHQPVTVEFELADPYWLQQGTESWSWGDGTVWGANLWGGAATPRSLTALTNDFTETVAGVHTTFPRLTLQVPAGASVTNPRIQRIRDNLVADEVAYTGVIGAGSTLEINTRRLSVRLNSVNAYGAAFAWQKPSWFRLEPGANTIRVLMDAKTGTPTLTLRYYTRW